MASHPVRLRIAASLAAFGIAANLPPGAGSAQEPQPRFRSGVEVIEVAILARDEAGRPVTDLRSDEITVLENGAPQQIVALTRVSLPRDARRSAPDSVTVRDVASNENLEDGCVFVLVLDALHIAPARLPAVKRHARQFIEQHVGRKDLVAVFSPGAAPDATEDFTTDRHRLLGAIDRFTATKVRSATVERLEEERWADLTGVKIHDGRDPSDGERVSRVRALASVLQNLARHLDRIEGRRKALLLFSEGVDYDLGDILGVAQRDGSAVIRAMSDAVGALMRTNVALYAIDPRALSTAAGEMLEMPVHRQFKPGDTISPLGIEEERAASVRSLRYLAESTGGFAAVTSNDMAAGFERVIDESSEYYMAGYSPASPARPGESRSIEIRVSRPNVRVIARKGYVAPEAPRRASHAADPELPDFTGPAFGRRQLPAPTRTPASATPSGRSAGGPPPELASLLESPLPKAGLPMRVQAIPSHGDERKRAVHLVVEVLGRGLDFDQRGSRAEERIELALITVDDRGRGDNGRSTAIDLRLPPEELQRVRATGVRWLSNLELAPGRYQIRVAARAIRTGASGLVTHSIEVPRIDRNHLTLSGVTLTSLAAVVMPTRGRTWLDGALETPPSAARTFVRGDRIAAAVELYGPSALTLQSEVIAEVTSPDGAAVLAIKPTPGSMSVPGRARPIVFHMETGKLDVGRYMLRVLARTGGGERIERSLSFEIVPPQAALSERPGP